MLAVRVASTVRVGAPSPLRAAGAHMALFHDMAGSALPVKRGLYDPAAEKDSCGACAAARAGGVRAWRRACSALQRR